MERARNCFDEGAVVDGLKKLASLDSHGLVGEADEVCRDAGAGFGGMEL